MSRPTRSTERSRWARVQEIWQVLRPIWLINTLAIVTVVLLQVPQAVDALVDVADARFLSSIHRSLLVSVVILALCNWYTARVMLNVRYWFTPEERPSFAGWRLWVPRVLGLLPPLAVGLTYLRSSMLNLEPGNGDFSRVVDRLFFGVFYLAVAGVLLLLFKERRKRLLNKQPLGAPAKGMPRASRRVVGGILTLSLLLLLFFLAFKVAAPERLGPLAIVLYAIASWSAVGSLVLVYPTYRRRRPPLLLVALLLAAVFSLFNDNHGVRRGRGDPSAWQRPPIDRFFRDVWLPSRLPAWRSRFPAEAAPSPYPVVLVAAEGGGIRAAYWTAAVLGKLEDEVPGFSRHVFALSGVSGGSLGNAVYAALLADRPNAGGGGGSDPAAGGSERGFQQAASEVLKRDFLAPVLAGLLFPDFVQRFLPFSLLPDRAEYLERSWEEGWRRGSGSGSDRFGEDFRDLWSGDNPEQVPSLFFNGTWTRGERLVVSNLRPNGSFVEVDDVVEILGRPLPLSTAVGLSARFPYVSPAASLEVDGERRGIVDGGYFENSGALTAAEILDGLGPPAGDFLPVVLIVTNSGRGTVAPRRFLSELLAPPVAFYNTRLTRGFLAEEKLESAARARGYPALDFRLTRDLRDIEVPLGWVLSRRTRRTIDRQLNDGAFPQIEWLRGCLSHGSCEADG